MKPAYTQAQLDEPDGLNGNRYSMTSGWVRVYDWECELHINTQPEVLTALEVWAQESRV